MNRRFIINHFVIYDRLNILILATLWVLGIGIGVGLVAYNTPLIAQQTDLLTSQSTFGSLVTAVPLLLAIVFLWCEQPLMVCLLVFITAVSRGYTAFFVSVLFGGCGWLVGTFLLFSSSYSSVLFWCLILRHVRHRTPSFVTDILVAIVFLALIFAVEHSLISPYLLQITKYL